MQTNDPTPTNETKSSERPKRPLLRRVLWLIGLGTLALLPSQAFWERAQALSERGIFETVTVTRAYEEVEPASAADTGRVTVVAYIEFLYGPDKALERTLRTPGFAEGDTLLFGYDPQNLTNFVVNPKGRSTLLLYLSQWGVGLRAVIAGFGLLLYLLALLSIFERILYPKRGSMSED